MMHVKRFLKHACLALAGVAAAGFASLDDALAHHGLTITTWGGAYTRSQVLAYFRPYEEQTGTALEIERYNGGLAEIRQQVEALNIKWDVVDLTLSDTIRGCEEGLLEPIDHSVLPPAPDGTPAADDFIDGTLIECGVGQYLWSTLVAYDESRFQGARPAGIADFWDVKKFPGRRGMRKVPQKNLEWALIADGVPRERVYAVLDTPQGVERAFRSLSRIRPHIVWWEGGEEAPRLIAQGRAAMTTAWNGRVFDAVTNKGAPIGMVWEDSIWDIELWGIVRHTRRYQDALDFIRFATGAERLAAHAGHIAYGPARRSALALVGPKLKPHLPTTPENLEGAVRFDSEWWAANQERMNARFERWLEEPSAKPEQLPR